jgi:hypothetical protein
MHLSIFNSKYFPIIIFTALFLTLMCLWEIVIRNYYNPPIAIDYSKKEMVLPDEPNWLIFGNCLVLNGLSPKKIISELMVNKHGNYNIPKVLNISQHEHSPIAYFSYLDKAGYYPDIIFANISSWLNGTNFELETEQLINLDPLDIYSTSDKNTNLDIKNNTTADIIFSKKIETTLQHITAENIKQSNKRYHLFDYSLFLYEFLKTLNLNESLYNLRIQSWFKVNAIEKDGYGFLGLRVDYNNSWQRGYDVMAEKQLLRIKAGNFLTTKYWKKLDEYISKFKSNGTEIVLMRMPEHPIIRNGNDNIYKIHDKMNELALMHNISVIDFDTLLDREVKLFDSVHPDYEGSKLISSALANWIEQNHVEWLYRKN